MGEMRNTYKIIVGKSERKNHLDDLSIDGKVILKWIMGEIWREVVDWIRLVRDMRPVAGSCEHGNEPLGFHKRLEIS
jgi:hypothetical protein